MHNILKNIKPVLHLPGYGKSKPKEHPDYTSRDIGYKPLQVFQTRQNRFSSEKANDRID